MRNEPFHAVLAWSCRPAKCQCCAARVTIVVYRWWKSAAISTLDFFDWMESFLYCLCYKKSRHLMVLICTHILLFWLFWRKLKQPGNKNISRMMVDKDQQLSKASHLSKGMKSGVRKHWQINGSLSKFRHYRCVFVFRKTGILPNYLNGNNSWLACAAKWCIIYFGALVII